MGHISAQMTRYSHLISGFFVLAILLFSAGIASAGTVITQCNDCHGMPPKDAPRKANPHFRSYSSAMIGSHQKHLPVSAVAADCSVCHLAASATDHQNGVINMAASISGGTYGKGVFFNQTSIPVLDATATCSNVSCHNPYNPPVVTTPVWGTATAGCTACHNGAGDFGANGAPATGSHSLHLGIFATCSDCHAGAVSGTSGGAAHLNGTIDVTSYGYPVSVAKHTAGTYTGGTCSTASCHFNPYGTGSVKTPEWGQSAGCAACHNQNSGVAAAFDATYGAPATGAHNLHLAASVVCSVCHANVAKNTNTSLLHKDGSINVTGYATPISKHAIGTAYANSCAVICHGTSPTWGAITSNNTCTKCHGTGTVTVTAANREVIAPVGGTLTGTGQVSNNVKVGAHMTHLRYLNGFSNYSTIDYRCQACHGTLPTTGSHATGSSTPTFLIPSLANNWGARTGAAYNTGTFTCANTYCHNPSGTGGTLTNPGTATSPVWTDAAYIADGGKSLANCQKCHLVPGSVGFTKQSAHTGAAATTDTSASQCNGCHGHNGDIAGILGRRHLDGIRYASGNGACNGCHGYEVGSWAAAPAINGEGKGAHEKHITYLTTNRFTVTLAPATDTYAGATAAWTNVCGICHGSTLANHQNGTVNVALSTAYFFGTSGSATYNGTPGVLAAGNKTCSNVSCHYFTTPLWSTY